MSRRPGKEHIIFLFTVILICFIASCSIPPSKNPVTDIITQYFADKKFKVTELQIGNIKPIPMGEQRYMGTRGYFVEIKSITLEATENIGLPVQYKKGEQLTFSNATMTIREKSDKKGEWIISRISGIAIL